MRIAFVTDDERTVSQHFGRARYYLVVTLENGQIVARERREKPGHAQFASEAHDHEHGSDGHAHAHEHGHEHGRGPGAQGRHTRMAEVVADCQVVVGGGMGAGAYENLAARGIQPIVTDIRVIDEAIAAYLNQQLVDRPERRH